MKKKLLLVMTKLGAGGAEKALVNLLNNIDYCLFDVDLQLFQNTGMNMKFIPEKVNVLPPLNDNNYLFLNGFKFCKYAIFHFHFIKLMKRIFCNIIPLIKNNSYRNKAFYFWKFVKPYIKKNDTQYDAAIGYIQGQPIYYVVDCINAAYKIGWIHNDYLKLPIVPKEYEYLSKLYKLVTVSEGCVDSLKKCFPKLTNIKLIYNMNCPSLINKLADSGICPEFNNYYGVLKLITIGRLTYQKGYDIAVDAAAILKEKGISFKWYFMGDGELKHEILEQIQRKGLSEHVTLLGIRENPYPYLKKADMVIQTSRFEGKSIVVDEAKILKKLIVCTDYPSVNDQIVNETNGLIVPMSPKGVADGIIKLYNSPDLKNRIENNLQQQNNQYDDVLELHYKLFRGTL